MLQRHVEVSERMLGVFGTSGSSASRVPRLRDSCAKPIAVIAALHKAKYFQAVGWAFVQVRMVSWVKRSGEFLAFCWTT